MAQQHPLRGVEQFRQLVLDTTGRRGARPTHATRHPLHMRVWGDPRDAEGIAQHDIGSFPPHPGQPRQGVEIGWHLTVPFLDEDGGQVHHCCGLGVPEAQRSQHLFHLVDRSGSKVSGIRPPSKQFLSDRIHSLIGGLCRKNGGHEQFEWIAMIQFTVRIGIALAQQLIHHVNLALRRTSHRCGGLLTICGHVCSLWGRPLTYQCRHTPREPLHSVR